MKHRLFVISLAITFAAVLAIVGTGVYRWIVEGDRVACVATAFSFGCTTTLGWMLTGVGVAVMVCGAYIWERYRDK